MKGFRIVYPQNKHLGMLNILSQLHWKISRCRKDSDRPLKQVINSHARGALLCSSRGRSMFSPRLRNTKKDLNTEALPFPPVTHLYSLSILSHLVTPLHSFIKHSKTLRFNQFFRSFHYEGSWPHQTSINLYSFILLICLLLQGPSLKF